MDPSQIMNRSFVPWQQPPPPPAAEDPMAFPSPNPRPIFLAPAPGAKPGRAGWKGKKPADKRKKALGMAGPTAGGGGGYQPPSLSELQHLNRMKARRFYPKKKFPRFAPLAPRNTTSFIIRAKRAGGIASLVSPCPVTPAILPTPKLSPSREGLVDMAKEEWGVDGYGSMKGLIRLRPMPAAGEEEDEGEAEEGSSESDVEEHLEVDLSRFEMLYPAGGGSGDMDGHGLPHYRLENRVDDQDSHITRLEEENLTLKERLFLMETEMSDLRRRLQLLEAKYQLRDGNVVAMEASDNEEDGDGGGDVCSEKSVGEGDGESGGATPMRPE